MSSDAELSIKQDLSPETIVFRAIDRCNQLALTDDIEGYKKAVETIMDNLHPDKLVEIQEMKAEYTKEVWVYRKWGTRKVGTPEKPIHGSPALETRIDHRKLFHLIIKAFTDTGSYWKTEATNKEYGLFPQEEFKGDPATPEFDLKKKPSPNLEGSPNQIAWILHEGEVKKVMNWHGYAVGIGSGEKPWFFNTLQTSMTKQESVVIIITAGPGTGKTYFGIRLAEIFDKRFDPERQIVMDRIDTLRLISGTYRLRRGQVIIIDESQFGMSARRWGEKEQQELMEFLAAARYLGLIIIIVSLHISMIDAIARKHVVNHQIHIENRGEGIAYSLSVGRFMHDVNRYPPRKGKVILQLPDYDKCSAPSCLTCKHKEDCMTTRSRYERLKYSFLINRAKASAEKAEERAQMRKGINEDKVYLRIVEAGDKIEWTEKGFIDSVWIQDIVETEFNAKIGMTRARAIGKRVKLRFNLEKPKS